MMNLIGNYQNTLAGWGALICHRLDLSGANNHDHDDNAFLDM